MKNEIEKAENISRQLADGILLEQMKLDKLYSDEIKKYSNEICNDNYKQQKNID